MKKLQTNLAQFVKERNWERFHSPKNLAMALSVETAELVEIFQCRPRKQHAKSVIFFGHLLLALRRPQRLAIFRLECVLRDLSICDKGALAHICALVVAAVQVVP